MIPAAYEEVRAGKKGARTWGGLPSFPQAMPKAFFVRHDSFMRYSFSILVLSIAVFATVGCTNTIDLEANGAGCRWDSECASGEFCNAYGECRIIDDDSKIAEPAPTPEGTPSVLSPGPEAGEPDVGEPESEEPEVSPETTTPESSTPESSEPETNEPEEDAPECVDDSGCSNGLTCIDEVCVVGCDGVPAAGTCTPFELSYCAGPGTPSAAARTESILDPVCFGDILVDSCSADGEPLGINCVAAGGDCSQGACISMPEGQVCDDEELLCGDDDTGQPLACANKGADGIGVCERGCGDITFEGQCTGATMRFCADEGLATERIETYSCFDGEVCGEMRPGVDGCVGAQGQGDVCWNPESGDNAVSFCGGNGGGLACELEIDDGIGRCVVNNDVCDVSATGPECSGNRLMLYCYQSQPVILNCSDYGAQCHNSIGACTGVDRYQPCDETLRCAGGLQCRQGWCDL